MDHRRGKGQETFEEVSKKVHNPTYLFIFNGQTEKRHRHGTTQC